MKHENKQHLKAGIVAIIGLSVMFSIYLMTGSGDSVSDDTITVGECDNRECVKLTFPTNIEYEKFCESQNMRFWPPDKCKVNNGGSIWKRCHIYESFDGRNLTLSSCEEGNQGFGEGGNWELNEFCKSHGMVLGFYYYNASCYEIEVGGNHPENTTRILKIIPRSLELVWERK